MLGIKFPTYVWIHSVLDISHLRLVIAISCVAVPSFLHPSQLQCWHWFECSVMLIAWEIRKHRETVSCERTVCCNVIQTSVFQNRSFLFSTGEGGCVQGKTAGWFFCISWKGRWSSGTVLFAGPLLVLVGFFVCICSCSLALCFICNALHQWWAGRGCVRCYLGTLLQALSDRAQCQSGPFFHIQFCLIILPLEKGMKI